MCEICIKVKRILSASTDRSQEVIALLFEHQAIKNHASFFFNFYQRHLKAFGFDTDKDLYIEAVIRTYNEFVDSRGPRHSACWSYYRNLVRNICEEINRYLLRERSRLVMDTLKILAEITEDPYVIEKVKMYIAKQNCKCSTILYHATIEEEYITDAAMMVRILKDKCKQIYSENAIKVHKSNCLKELCTIIEQDPDGLF